MIDAILFDLGDTIINFGIDRQAAEVIFHHGARESYDYLQEHGKPLPAFDRYFRVHHRKMRNEYIWSKFIMTLCCNTALLIIICTLLWGDYSINYNMIIINNET